MGSAGAQRSRARFASLSRRATPGRDGARAGRRRSWPAAALVFALVRPQALLTQPRRRNTNARISSSCSIDRRRCTRTTSRRPRFSRATLEIRNFVRQKPEGIDRIALVGFADAADRALVPDRGRRQRAFYLDWIDADPTPLFGTNIGAALKSAMEVAQKDDRPTRKLFLLVSDGEDYGAELKRALVTARTRRLPA